MALRAPLRHAPTPGCFLGVLLCWKRRLCCPFTTAEWGCELERTKIFAPAARILVRPRHNRPRGDGGYALRAALGVPYFGLIGAP